MSCCRLRPKPDLACITEQPDGRLILGVMTRMEEAFDAICVTWYLSATTDHAEALNQLKADIVRLQKRLG